MLLNPLLRILRQRLLLLQQARRHRIRSAKRLQYLQQATAARGGQVARDAARRQRQADIRQQKRAIIEGLLRSWALGEIRRPDPGVIFDLQYYSRGKSLAQLQQLEAQAWS